METLIPRIYLHYLEPSAITELDLNLIAEDVENCRDVLNRQNTFVQDFTRRMNEEITARRRNFVQLYAQCAPKRILVEKILRLHDRNNNYRASLTALNDATDDYKRRIQQWKKATVGVLAKMHEMRQSRRATNSAGVDEQGPSTSSDGVCSGTTAATGGTRSDKGHWATAAMVDGVCSRRDQWAFCQGDTDWNADCANGRATRAQCVKLLMNGNLLSIGSWERRRFDTAQSCVRACMCVCAVDLPFAAIRATIARSAILHRFAGLQ
uniref:Inhibitor of growth protein N-terminal histone-binding domain-containing protein n=1 Tax=Trichuris muris TaxID=70415 RepID=A0A5S6Q9E4_TRIMR